MNVHHLELFYYVAKHGGISAAVRKIPYGIQQPAVSGQVGSLEKDLGVRLFERSPFRLTPAGADPASLNDLNRRWLEKINARQESFGDSTGTIAGV